MSPRNLKIIIVATALVSALLPTALVFAAGGPLSQIVPNCGFTLAGNTVNGTACGWKDVLSLANNLLKFMIYLAVPIAAICFAYAGWLYLSSQGNSGKISRAHGIFLNVAIGLVIVLAAWLVVNQIMTTLANPSGYTPVLQTVNGK